MRIVVEEWERILRYRNGRFTEVLEPGVHRRLRWRQRLVRADLRPRLLTMAGQEMLTADGVAVKISLLVRTRITDPRRWHETVADPDGFVYAALQIGVRDAVATRTLDALLAARGELGGEVTATAAGTAAEVGTAIDQTSVRDVMVPAELRRAAMEAVSAQAQGRAALERARAEVAANRALLNAARLLADNPALLQLRTLQAVEAGGATVVLTTGQPLSEPGRPVEPPTG